MAQVARKDHLEEKQREDNEMQTRRQERGHEKKPRIFGIRRATGMAIRKLPRATAVTKTVKSSGNF